MDSKNRVLAPGIPALCRPVQEDWEFEATVGYTTRPGPNKAKQ